MTDFGLMDGYHVHNRLDQREVFSSLLWHIFYDPLLCEVKCQKSVYGYRINSHFISRSGCAESWTEFSSFLAVGTFVNNTIWVGSSQNTTQHILDVVIHKGESHQYLGIFLSTKGLFKPNLAKAHSDICFFTNLVLKKAVLDKQFLYLVSIVLYPIVGYRTQFSFVLIMIQFIILSFMVPISIVLGKSLFFKFLPSLWHYDIVFVDQLHDCYDNVFNWCTFKWWKKLDPREPVLNWFKISVAFLIGSSPALPALSSVGSLNICGFSDFVSICNHLSQVGPDSLSVYMNGSLKSLGTIGCQAGAAAFFEDINLGLDVSVHGLVSSTLAELQIIALALECVPRSCSVCLFSDSQAALDAYKLELNLMHPDFYNWCWVEHWHISNIIRSKNLKVTWCKVKSHSGILGNDCANSFTDTASFSEWFFSPYIGEHFLVANGDTVSGNSKHFVWNVFCAIGSGSGFLASDLLSDVDWLSSSQIWHPDSHMAADFTSRHTADTRTYFIKALYHQLPIACYSNVLCLYCGKVKMSNHVFSCMINISACHKILESCASFWKELSTKIKVAKFVHSLCFAFRDDIWVVYAKHRTFMEKHRLILIDGFASVLVSGSALKFLAGVVKLLGISKAFGVHFGFRKPCLFFSGVGTLVLVNITA
ncbi:hypothetical protein G9A89_006030 [Geosiphon pyriformis]|nr:hypothetical protein G9A89_006030 [Geosiphon pyriformis]